jgi:hypothetical protein
MNNGKFDGGQLTDSEKALRDFMRLLNFSAVLVNHQEIQTMNRQSTEGFDGGYLCFHTSDTQQPIRSLISHGY